MKKNLAVSVRQRLLNVSRAQREDFNRVLTRYAIERLLYRVGQSAYAGQFILKGAALFLVWTGQLHRPTRDIDFLGLGDASTTALKRTFEEICSLQVEPDGIRFDGTAIEITEIREIQAYPGWRVHIPAQLDTVSLRLQIDIGFGDVVKLPVSTAVYPSLLDLPAPMVKIYPKETVISEKLEAMVKFGMLNSRLKDFYDVWFLCRTVSFDGATLASSIYATFKRRGTPHPTDVPVALTSSFGRDGEKAKQWQAFLNRNDLTVEQDFSEIVADLSRFLLPPLQAAGEPEQFSMRWFYPDGWYE